MNRRRNWIGAALIAAALAIAIAGFTLANGADDDEPLTGTDLERATQAALAHTGGGTVLETELGDDGAAYGVEIRKDDGSIVEVSLDASFNVIGDEVDEDDDGGDDGQDDD